MHADILVIEPGDTGNIKVDQVREAIDRSAYRPFEGRRRLVVVDEADALMPEAQNALLKTLEEPPPASVFVLITSRPDVLLPTVRSRCQRLRFGPLTPGEVADVLIRITTSSRRTRMRPRPPRTAASGARWPAAPRTRTTRATPRPGCCRAPRRPPIRAGASTARRRWPGTRAIATTCRAGSSPCRR